MKRQSRIFLAAAAALLIVAAWPGYSCKRAEKGGAGEEESCKEGRAVPRVKVVPLQKKEITEEMMVYGVVAVAPGAARTLSLPYQCRVRRLMVTAGQTVTRDSELIEIEPGPDAALEYSQAKNDGKASAEELRLINEKFERRLATREDVVQAEQKDNAAKLLVQNLEQRGINKPNILKSGIDGVVSEVSAQKGQLVSAGEKLLEIVGQEQIGVRLGVEDGDKNYLHPGQTASLYPVNVEAAGPVTGRITIIGRQLNPETRLVDVFVELPADSGLLLNSYVRGVITVASAGGLVVPRAAALPVEGEYILFTVDDKRAHKHVVHIGLQNKREIQAIDESLKEGEQVVVVGNAELEDGMTVEAEPAP